MRTRPFILVANGFEELYCNENRCYLKTSLREGDWLLKCEQLVGSARILQLWRNQKVCCCCCYYYCCCCHTTRLQAPLRSRWYCTSSHSTPHCFTTFFHLRLSLASVPSCHVVRLSFMLHNPPMGERSKLCRCTWLQNYVTWHLHGNIVYSNAPQVHVVRSLTNYCVNKQSTQLSILSCVDCLFT